eukprot:529455-Rhodomonas_salina.1
MIEISARLRGLRAKEVSTWNLPSPPAEHPQRQAAQPAPGSTMLDITIGYRHSAGAGSLPRCPS